MKRSKTRLFKLLLFLMVFLLSCQQSNQVDTPTPVIPPEEIIFYDWPGEPIINVFDEFTAEYGIRVQYVEYESQEEALDQVRAGESYDIVVMDNEFIPTMVREGLLAEIDYRNIPNFNNISANFRDLTYDPKNAHSVPYSWGSTGLIVRTDLVKRPVTQWGDLWDPEFAGKVILWESTPRYTLGIALASLGYSVNSENMVELEEALDKLRELKSGAIWMTDEETSADHMASGEGVIAMGWAYDYWAGLDQGAELEFITPREGLILWGDNFVIPSTSKNKQAAELLLNFILRPKVSAQIVNEINYPMANEAASPYIDREILFDPVIFPSSVAMSKAEILLPLSIQGEALYAEIWKRFLEGEG